MNTLMTLLKGTAKMAVKLDKTKLQEYLKNAPKFDDEFAKDFEDDEYVQLWLEHTLTQFLNTGNVDEFIDCLVDVVKNSKRGTISHIASTTGLNRANIYDIMAGKVTPRIDTAFKLINGLGYNFDIKLTKSA